MEDKWRTKFQEAGLLEFWHKLPGEFHWLSQYNRWVSNKSLDNLNILISTFFLFRHSFDSNGFRRPDLQTDQEHQDQARRISPNGESATGAVHRNVQGRQTYQACRHKANEAEPGKVHTYRSDRTASADRQSNEAPEKEVSPALLWRASNQERKLQIPIVRRTASWCWMAGRSQAATQVQGSTRSLWWHGKHHFFCFGHQLIWLV